MLNCGLHATCVSLLVIADEPPNESPKWRLIATSIASPNTLPHTPPRVPNNHSIHKRQSAAQFFSNVSFHCPMWELKAAMGGLQPGHLQTCLHCSHKVSIISWPYPVNYALLCVREFEGQWSLGSLVGRNWGVLEAQL
mgnify:FL=1